MQREWASTGMCVALSHACMVAVQCCGAAGQMSRTSGVRGSHGRQYGPCIYAQISLMHLPMKQSLHTYQEYFSHRYSIKLLSWHRVELSCPVIVTVLWSFYDHQELRYRRPGSRVQRGASEKCRLRSGDLLITIYKNTRASRDWFIAAMSGAW